MVEPRVAPRRVLLAVIGLSPAVVTETLYWLGTQAQPWHPSEVHLITTLDGATRAVPSLSSAPGTALHQLCADYDLPLPRCDAATLHIVADANGQLADLRTAADNEAAANCILRLVSTLCADADTEVHFSIAGGRKTMGYLLGYCASLLGRPCDALSHVLVNPPFDSIPAFLYPPLVPQSMKSYSGAQANTRDARIELAYVPFIRLRALLPQTLLAGTMSFTETMAVVNAIGGDPSLELALLPAKKPGGRCIGIARFAGGLEIVLPVKSFAMYWLLACAATRGVADERVVDMECDMKLVESDYLSVYRALTASSSRYDEEATRLRALPGFERAGFVSALMNLNRDLKRELGNKGLDMYGPHSFGRRGELAYGLKLPGESIRLLGNALVKG